MTTPPETPRPDPSRPDDEHAPALPASGGLRRDRTLRGADDGEPAGIEPGRELGTGATVTGSRDADVTAIDGGVLEDGGAHAGDTAAGGGSPDASDRFAPPRVHEGGVTSGPSAHDDAATLGARTYDRIPEPRSQRRLPLGDGTWYQLARAYVRVQLISQGVFFLLVVAVAVTVQVITGVQWQWIPAGVVLVVTLFGLVITPRQARSVGYQLRRDDLVFRRGILWQRVVAVPYGRMQLVDITHGPLDRGFGIAQLKLVTAAASTGVTIPGLTQEAAEHLRDTLVAVAETRRTGL